MSIHDKHITAGLIQAQQRRDEIEEEHRLAGELERVTAEAYIFAINGDSGPLRVALECIVRNPLYTELGADGRPRGWESHVMAIMAIANGVKP